MAQKVLIGGQWRESQAKETFQADNPATKSTLPDHYPISSWDDCDAALAAASKAAEALRTLPPERLALFLERFADLIEAKALLDAGLSDIDCLVTDIGMPSMDGFDLLDAVKRERPDLPVFLITGRHEIGDQERANTKDIRGFFRKPFSGPTLLAAVGDALRA